MVSWELTIDACMCLLRLFSYLVFCRETFSQPRYRAEVNIQEWSVRKEKSTCGEGISKVNVDEASCKKEPSLPLL